MLFATLSEGLPFFVISALGLIAIGAAIVGTIRAANEASPAGHAVLGVVFLVLLAGFGFAAPVGLWGFSAVDCAPDQYECPF